ncbi:MAG TPA: SulP family inorganic anion transporter [Gemmataceae bacterium]|nr:SulP family inorganic anion transporter [Gemmataceae bacterium]
MLRKVPRYDWPALSPRRWLRAYGWSALRRDLIAGLTVATVAVPQAMAYALIAGIEPRYGLYTAVVMTAVASVLGSSSHLINGPTNAISIVVFSVAAGLSTGPDDPHRIAVVGLLAVLVGLLQVLIALLRLGDLTRYISESVILGFMAGAGSLVALTQVQNLLGQKAVGTGEEYLLYRLWRTWTEGGPVNFWSLGIGLATLALVMGLHRLSRRFKVRLPELLISLVAVSALVWLCGIPAGGGKPLHVEPQLPAFRLPALPTPENVRHLWGGALAVALLGLVEALAIAKSIAARTREPLDYNRQCLAEGIANLSGGLFQCMPGSGSLTRSAINYFAGAATRLSGIFAAVAVAVSVLLFAPLADHVPRAALAGILMWTAYRIVDRQRLWYCLRATRFDAGIALATAFASVFISLEFSILIGTFLSFLFFVPRASRLHASELVLGPDRAVRERQPGDPACPRLVVFSLEGNLFFGAAPELAEHLAELTRRADAGARVILLRLKRARNPDMVCLEHLQRFLKDMEARKVTVLLCGVREDFAQALRNLDFYRWLPPECVFLEDGAVGSSTLQAVRRAYELLGTDLCETCPRRHEKGPEKPDWYYMI